MFVQRLTILCIAFYQKLRKGHTQRTFPCSNSTIETRKKCKFVQSLICYFLKKNLSDCKFIFIKFINSYFYQFASGNSGSKPETKTLLFKKMQLTKKLNHHWNVLLDYSKTNTQIKLIKSWIIKSKEQIMNQGSSLSNLTS